MIRIVGIAQGKFLQGRKVTFDPVEPTGIRWRENQMNPILVGEFDNGVLLVR